MTATRPSPPDTWTPYPVQRTPHVDEPPDTWPPRPYADPTGDAATRQ